MTQKFEDYEALERYRAEWEISMKRIEEAKRRRTRMEHRQQRARIIWLVTIFVWAAFLLFILLWLHPLASTDERAAAENTGAVVYEDTIGPELPEDFENEKIEAALYETS